jgi:hypothetical protein
MIYRWADASEVFESRLDRSKGQRSAPFAQRSLDFPATGASYRRQDTSRSKSAWLAIFYGTRTGRQSRCALIVPSNVRAARANCRCLSA